MSWEKINQRVIFSPLIVSFEGFSRSEVKKFSVFNKKTIRWLNKMCVTDILLSSYSFRLLDPSDSGLGVTAFLRTISKRVSNAELVLHTVESLWLYELVFSVVLLKTYCIFLTSCITCGGFILLYFLFSPLYKYCIEPGDWAVGVQAGFTSMANLFQMSLRNSCILALLINQTSPCRTLHACSELLPAPYIMRWVSQISFL